MFFNGEFVYVNIIFREDDGNVGFVVILYVWVDGFGNVRNNVFFVCLL